jgi:hypothetical protein
MNITVSGWLMNYISITYYDLRHLIPIYPINYRIFPKHNNLFLWNITRKHNVALLTVLITQNRNTEETV